jgi:hypothetical protein
MYSEDEYQEDIAYLEECRSRVRLLIVAASEPNNPWKQDGLESKRQLDILEELMSKAELKRRMTKMGIAKRIERQRLDRNEGKTTKNGPQRTSLGTMWKTIDKDRALRLKQNGFQTRFIGTGWQVKLS